jgi:hypothetical protein
MIRPHKISMYVYAETPAEAALLQDTLHDFAVRMYERGILVRAEVLAGLLQRYGDSPIVANILNDGTTQKYL